MTRRTESIELPDIILNKEKRYSGDLSVYVQNLFFCFHNVDLPYHNARHMLDVLFKVYQGAVFHQLKPREFRNILIAAIYHDANHPGQLNGMDTNSVERAIETLRRDILPEDKRSFDAIRKLILATEFPHRLQPKGARLSISEKIIRDADLSMTLSPVWVQQILFGLAQEKRASIKQILFDQVAFIKSHMNFVSGWGQDNLEELKQERICQIHQWIELLGLKHEYEHVYLPSLKK